MWNRKPKPIRPIGRWKNGKTLFLIWAGGTFLILSAALSALYPIQYRIQEIRGEEAQAKAYEKKYRDILQPDFEAPDKPTQGELSSLQEKVPVTVEPARLLTALEKAVQDAGTQWVELRTAEKASELPEPEGKNGKKGGYKEFETELPPLPELPGDSHLHPRWADLYVQGTEEQLLTLFGTLHQMKRTVSVQGWEYVAGKKEKPGHIRIRLTWYVYQDSNLKRLPPLSELEIPQEGKGSSPPNGDPSDKKEEPDAKKPSNQKTKEASESKVSTADDE